jgi:glycerophosphoryl diester phosphodiesterase
MIVFFIIISVLAALFLIYALILVFPGVKRERAKSFSRFFTDYAHRGLWGDGIPENSLAAFNRAVEKGFGIELDVRLSSDGVVYVFHDNNLKRMTGVDRQFIEMSSEEIDKLRLNNSGEVIPRFADVLSLIDGRIPLMVELKCDNFDTSVCVQTDKLLSGYKGDYCIESFNPWLVGWYRKNRSEIMRGQLVEFKKKPLPFLISTLILNNFNRPDFISYRYSRYNRLSTFLATNLWGAKRVVWTVKSPEVRQECLSKGISVIFEGFVPDE